MLALLIATGATACPVERAHYVLRASPGVTAEFHAAPANEDWPRGLALAIHVQRTGRTYWGLPWNGGTDRRQHVRFVRAVGDNLPTDVRLANRDIDFLGTDASYAFLDAVPDARGSAPFHFLLPWLGPTLWHSTAVGVRDDVPQAFFDLVACGPQANAPAGLDLPAVP